MLKTTIIGLMMVLANAAMAQDAAQPDSNAPPPAAQPPGPPVDAMLHHQPSQKDVVDREIARNGAKTVEKEQSQEQRDVDALYKQLMSEPIPAARK